MGYTLKRVVDVYVSQVAATVSPEPATVRSTQKPLDIMSLIHCSQESKEGSNDVKNKK